MMIDYSTDYSKRIIMYLLYKEIIIFQEREQCWQLAK